FSPAVRLRVVELVIAALSRISMITVRMSPTLLARWSFRKAREPGRHSEFGCRSIGCGAGIGSDTAWGAASGAGLLMALSFGSSPTLARRLIMLQALSVRPIR